MSEERKHTLALCLSHPAHTRATSVYTCIQTYMYSYDSCKVIGRRHRRHALYHDTLCVCELLKHTFKVALVICV